ncbi:hypothetical protein HMPREF0063_10498 [Aeromicrobium marinum DSM 15272]|uniref:Uncharacterized protein n=1 Tax=Aeromicrobium marinum DSM 15272 TaxID=585531 RepID=E2S8Z0_9ACTN|nr:hypothetical protein [Aeromicrobium marinum]EFQ84645.1 hypothetical protein HMPREF0063_10498 [Aeromicrobium marinum DSM 15272]
MTTTRAQGRRRLDASVPAEYELPVRQPRLDSPATAVLVRNVVAAAWALGTLVSALVIVDVDLPGWIFRPAAALLTVALTVGLTHRAGGHLRIWPALAGVLCLLAVALQTNGLLVAAAALTGVVGAVWAVMVTRPADGLVEILREFVVALTVAASGAVGVAAWNAPVDVETFSFVVVAAAITLAISMVWALGAGLHGLGRLHLAVLVGVAVAVVAVIAYGSIVRAYGSPGLLALIDDVVYTMRTTIGGVPRPVEVFIGFPALVVGVSMRSVRREGWWVLVFAVIGTAVVTTSLVSPGAYPTYITLSTLYSAVLGLGLGLAARRVLGSQSAIRSARAVQEPHRVEPPRLSGLK